MSKSVKFNFLQPSTASLVYGSKDDKPSEGVCEEERSPFISPRCVPSDSHSARDVGSNHNHWQRRENLQCYGVEGSKH